MSARGQGELTPSSVPSTTLLRWLEALRKDVDELQESKARDGLPYPLRWKSTKISNAPSFHIQLWNPITGELCDICDSGGGLTICDCEDGAPGPPGEQGEPGPPGDPGADGPPGVGVPTGGTTGQSLVKLSNTNYDTGWSTVSGGGASALDDLTDVIITSPTDLASLFFDNASGKWIDGYVPLTAASDVNTTGEGAGDFLKFDGSNWVPGDVGVLNSINDVDTTGVVDGDVLTYDSGDWIAQAPSTAIVVPDPGGSSLPAIGTEGRIIRFKHVLFEDNGLYWWPHGGRMEQIQYEWTNFFNNNAQKQEIQSSTSGGTNAMGASPTGTQGLIVLDTSTSATGRSHYGATAAIRGTGDKIMHVHTRVRFPTLSTGTERYQFVAGFIDKFTAEPADGFYFRYDDSVSANWYCVTANNSARTATDSTVAVATNTFQKLRIEIDEIAGTAKFYIDDVLKVTTSSSTNFPGSGRDHGPGIGIRKSVGTTSRTAEVDYYGYWSLMTTTI